MLVLSLLAPLLLFLHPGQALRTPMKLQWRNTLTPWAPKSPQARCAAQTNRILRNNPQHISYQIISLCFCPYWLTSLRLLFIIPKSSLLSLPSRLCGKMKFWSPSMSYPSLPMSQPTLPSVSRANDFWTMKYWRRGHVWKWRRLSCYFNFALMPPTCASEGSTINKPLEQPWDLR